MKNALAKTIVGVAVATTVVGGLGAGAASAGEIKGTYKNTDTLEYIAGDDDAPLNGRSECAYSGLDEPDDLSGHDGDDELFANTQNYGQIVKVFGADPGTGGASGGCNPNNTPPM